MTASVNCLFPSYECLSTGFTQLNLTDVAEHHGYKTFYKLLEVRKFLLEGENVETQ